MKKMHQIVPRTLIIVAVGLAVLVACLIHPARANGQTLCGNGSSPDYGFTDSLRQPHWTVGWQGYASEEAVNSVDRILDRLNNASIAQTMILIKPQDEVGNRVNCAVHFLRYMKLGLPSGARKDNGFVFLIVVEPDGIDVHYGVGLGLPALTASELTNLNRVAEAAYESTGSMDEALLTLVREFDSVARSNYEPFSPPTPSVPRERDNLPAEPMDLLSLCCQMCLGFFFLMFVLWWLSQAGSSGGRFGGGPTGWGGWSGPRRWGGGFRGFPGGGGWRGPSMRGGSGSGRSGRGN